MTFKVRIGHYVLTFGREIQFIERDKMLPVLVLC